MDILMHAATAWFIIGFILFVLEFIVPGLILFFFGVGAWVVAVLLLFVDISLNIQLIIFLLSSIITIVLLRGWMKRILYGRNPSTELLEDEFLGRIAIAKSPISPGRNGDVYFKGTNWQASSADYIEPDENVKIIGNDSILLIVQSTKIP
ncbi:MAG: NfeD family protein [Ginsengibacter sp.]|jgi:membrane protein implicated in regulation of membrane protease activity